MVYIKMACKIKALRCEMNEILNIILLSSICTRNEYYLKNTIEAADKLGLKYKIERVTDNEVLKSYDVYNRCKSGAYCPGCNRLNDFRYGDDSTMFAPALVINGQVVLHSCIFTKDVVEGVLARYAENEEP
jgi:hypothetical protein